jgi:hypothetical protein
LEVGAEGEFKLDLRQDSDPGKQKLKGAVRTKNLSAPLLPRGNITLCFLRTIKEV